MLKVSQKVFCPIHKTIGTVMWMGEESGECQGDVCIKTEKDYNVWCNKEGKLSHTDLIIAKPLPYNKDEHVVVRMENGNFHFGVIKEAIVDEDELKFNIHLESSNIQTFKSDSILSIESLLDITLAQHSKNYQLGLAKQKYILKKDNSDENE